MNLQTAYKDAKKTAKVLMIPTAVVIDNNQGDYSVVTTLRCIRYREKRGQLKCVFNHEGKRFYELIRNQDPNQFELQTD